MTFSSTESLDDPAHLVQETQLLGDIMDRLVDSIDTYRDLQTSLDFDITFVPFSDRVDVDDVREISSNGYSSSALFREAEHDAFEQIKNKLSATGEYLTNIVPYKYIFARHLLSANSTTVPTFNSCTKCMGCPGITHNHMPNCHQVSRPEWMQE